MGCLLDLKREACRVWQAKLGRNNWCSLLWLVLPSFEAFHMQGVGCLPGPDVYIFTAVAHLVYNLRLFHLLGYGIRLQ